MSDNRQIGQRQIRRPYCAAFYQLASQSRHTHALPAGFLVGRRHYATIEEYFPPLTAEEVAQAPSLSFKKTMFDFGSIKENRSVHTEM